MFGIPLVLAVAHGENTPLNLPSDTTKHLSTAQGGSGSLVRTIVGLAVVIGVIYGVAWILRQVKESRETATRGVGLANEATIALGPNRALHLVRAGTELVLVGVAETGVTPIRTYTEEEARAVGLLADPDAPDSDDDDRPGGPRPRSRKPAPGQPLWLERLRSITAR